MHAKVYIGVNGDVTDAVLFENGEPVKRRTFTSCSASGCIYRGKVEKVISAGAFVDIGRARQAFLSPADGLKRGDFVTVQALREEEGEKGCLLTRELSLSGKYAVVLGSDVRRFSGRLGEGEREFLKQNFPEEKGLIFRSACKDGSVEAIREDIISLKEKLSEIIDEGKNLYEIKLLFTPDRIEEIKNSADEAVFSLDEIKPLLEEAEGREVIYKNAVLVFDKTEAMTVIDVNSRTDYNYSDTEAMAYDVNLNAVEGICRQLVLRNIGGMAAVDFITMKDETHWKKVCEKFSFGVKKTDKTARIFPVKELGVVLVGLKKNYSSI